MGKHDDLTARAHERIVLELRNRTGLQILHALFGILVGLAIALTGAPAPIEDLFGPWGRVVLGFGLALTGLVILIGSALTDNSRCGWAALTFGSIVLIGWHTLLCTTYAKATFDSPLFIIPLGSPITDPSAGYRAYIPFVYMILA
jgi:hypothetical protein